MELSQNYSFFAKTELEQFRGQWIAICNQEIVAYGKELKKVLEESKQKYPTKKPLIVRVPEKETMIF